MKGIMDLLRRFGGAGLLESLPGIHDFNERLQKNAKVSADLEERLASIELDLANQGRLKQIPRKASDDYPHD